MTSASPRDLIAARLPVLADLGASYRFELAEGGSVFVDAAGNPARIAEAPDGTPADCTFKLQLADLPGLLDGSIDPLFLYTEGRLKVVGSIEKAMNLAQRLSPAP